MGGQGGDASACVRRRDETKCGGEGRQHVADHPRRHLGHHQQHLALGHRTTLGGLENQRPSASVALDDHVATAQVASKSQNAPRGSCQLIWVDVKRLVFESQVWISAVVDKQVDHLFTRVAILTDHLKLAQGGEPVCS